MCLSSAIFLANCKFYPRGIIIIDPHHFVDRKTADYLFVT